MAVGDKIVIANKSEMLLDFDNVYSAFGYTKELKKSDRFEETDTPYVIQDKGGDVIRFTKGLVNRDSTETIHLPLAPFADGSGDEVLSHSDNGFATQSDHKAGDIIHCGNGAFAATNLSDYITTDSDFATVSEDNGVLTITVGDGYRYQGAKLESILEPNITYEVELNVTEASESTSQWYVETDGTYRSAFFDGTTTGVKRVYVKNILSNDLRILDLNNENESTIKVDSIKIRVVEQTYQATTSTTAGDLITDSTKFSKINFISRQDVIFIGEDGKYKTIKGYHTFHAGFSVDDVANAYGFTKVGKGLFSVKDLSCIDHDGTEITHTGEITAISLVSRLNAGAYHPAHNALGTVGFNKEDDWGIEWYRYDVIPENLTSSTFLCLKPAVSGVVGGVSINDVLYNRDRRPTSLGNGFGFAHVFFEGLGGLIYRNTLAAKPNKKDLLEDETNKFTNVDDMSEECGIITYKTHITGDIFYYNDHTYFNIDYSILSKYLTYNNARTGYEHSESVVGAVVSSNNTVYPISDIRRVDSTRYVAYLWDKYGDIRSEFSVGDTIMYQIPNNQLLQQGKALTLDVVGNPAKYTISDSPTELHSDSTDSSTLLRQGALCWNVSDNKMYVYVDTDARDNVDMTAEDFSDTAKYEYVIGRYQNSWYDRLDSGLSLPFNALLVNQKGESVDDYSKLILSKKAYSWLSEVQRNNNAVAYETTGNNFDYILNMGEDASYPIQTTKIKLYSYTSLPSPTTQTDPKQVLMVSDKVLASNSHSWYQGGGVINAVTGKVSVGNGVNRFESKQLGDAHIREFKLNSSTKDLQIDADVGTVIYVEDASASMRTDSLPVDGHYYMLSRDGYGSYTYTFGGFPYGDTLWAIDLGTEYDGSYIQVQKKPSHSTISLDNSNSPASKAFTTLCVDDNDELLIGVVGEEMVWDFGSDNDNIINWAVGDSDLVCSKGYLVRLFGFDNSQFNSRVFLILEDGYTINWDSSTIDGKTILDNGDILNSDGSINNSFRLWDGNGFGTSNKFNKLTNGTITDLNGNTVRTYSGFKRTGYYI